MRERIIFCPFCMGNGLYEEMPIIHKENCPILALRKTNKLIVVTTYGEEQYIFERVNL